jgi:hypothetical protein
MLGIKAIVWPEIRLGNDLFVLERISSGEGVESNPPVV